jgi:hypothetical protein
MFMEMMFVVQADIYFKDGVSLEEQNEILEPLEEYVSFKRDNILSVRMFEFFDNCVRFESKEFKDAVIKMKDNENIRLAGFYIWKMETDNPDWRIDIRN